MPQTFYVTSGEIKERKAEADSPEHAVKRVIQQVANETPSGGKWLGRIILVATAEQHSNNDGLLIHTQKFIQHWESESLFTDDELE